MKADVESVSPEETAQAAALRMHDAHVTFLPVCDDTRKVLGTITDRDLTIRVLAEGRPGSTPVREVMTEHIVACRVTDDVVLAEQAMAEHHTSRVVCLDNAGRLVGVITLSDIAQEDPGQAAETLRDVTERGADITD